MVPWLSSYCAGFGHLVTRQPELAVQLLLHEMFYTVQGCCLTNISGAQKDKSQNVRSPTGNVLGAAAKI